LGNNYKTIYDGKKLLGYRNADGTKVFRILYKSGRQVYEANFEEFVIECGKKIKITNAHLEIIQP